MSRLCVSTRGMPGYNFVYLRLYCIASQSPQENLRRKDAQKGELCHCAKKLLKVDKFMTVQISMDLSNHSNRNNKYCLYI